MAARANADSRLEGKTLDNMAQVYQSLQRKPEALAAYRQALEVWRALGDSAAATKDQQQLDLIQQNEAALVQPTATPQAPGVVLTSKPITLPTSKVVATPISKTTVAPSVTTSTLENGIVAPNAGTSLRGIIPIQGVATNEQLIKWRLDLVSTSNPDQANTIAESTQAQPELTTLGQLDTTQQPNGSYLLRLRISRTGGYYDEYYLQVSIANP
jgi:hypothetical protein